MSDVEMQRLAAEIDALIDKQAREDRARAVAEKTDLIAGSYGAKEAAENADSQVEPWENFRRGYSAAQLFAPFEYLPDPTIVDETIKAINGARTALRFANGEMLSNLGPETNNESWNSPAGEAFRLRRAGLNKAVGEHMLLADELSSLCETYKALLEGTRQAARELASRSIERLKALDAEVPTVNWSRLIDLVLIGAAALTGPAAPATGGTLLAITRVAATVKSIADAGDDVLKDRNLKGQTVWDVLASLADLLRRLQEGSQAKAQWIADAFFRTPALIEDNRAVVMPEPPNLPSS